MNRIAIISQYYKPEIGAAQNRLYELAVGLKSKGWQVSIITAMPNYPFGMISDQYSGRFFLKERIDDLDVRRYWLFASNSKNALPRIISMLSFSLTVLFSLKFLRRNRFDYLFIESPPILLGISGYFLSRLSKSKLIFNVSDLWPLTAKELGYISNDFLYKSLVKLERFIYKKSFICLGQSQEIVNHLRENNASKVYLFRNGVDPDRFIKRTVAKGEYQIKIVYTGLLGVAQGILDICKNINFSELGIQFHLYGAGSEKEQLVEFLKDNSDRGIFYHGTVSRNEIPLLLSNYSATLIPLAKSIKGAVPSKIFESMAAGLPILFSGDGEGRLLIEKYDLGWVSSPKDYKALKTNLKKLFLKEESLETKSRNCIHAASTLFNRPKLIAELHEYLISFIE
jgi:glycosyltransferase involved in cell wall biosynthesis